jgi:hypothetical protein
VRTRLHTIDEAVADELQAMDLAQAKQAAIAACDVAWSKVQSGEPVIQQALELLRSGNRVGWEVLQRIQTIAEQLDRHYLDLRDAADRGERSEDEVLNAFAAARAVSAIACAMDGTREGYVEAIYEAHASLGDWGFLRPIVIGAPR